MRKKCEKHIPISSKENVLDGCKPILKFTEFPTKSSQAIYQKRKKKNTQHFRTEENVWRHRVILRTSTHVLKWPICEKLVTWNSNFDQVFPKPIPLTPSKEPAWRAGRRWAQRSRLPAPGAQEAGGPLDTVLLFSFGQRLLCGSWCPTCLLPQLQIFLRNTGQGWLLQLCCCFTHSNRIIPVNIYWAHSVCQTL